MKKRIRCVVGFPVMGRGVTVLLGAWFVAFVLAGHSIAGEAACVLGKEALSAM